MKRRYLITLAMVLGMMAVAAFVLGQSLSSPVASAQAMARVRVAHAVPDAPLPVNVLIDGNPIAEMTAITFPTVTDYVEVTSGTVTVTLVVPPSPDPLLTKVLTVVEGNDYTLAAYGTVADEVKLLQAVDNNGVPPVGKARARFYHFVEGVPVPVNVAIQDGPVLLTGVSYGQATSYVTVAQGTHNLELQIGSLKYPVPPVTAAPNTVYSFFAVGSLSSPDIIQVVDQEYVRVRAFHGVSDAPPVDIWVDGTKVFEGLAYKQLTDYAALMSGTYTVSVAPAGTEIAVLSPTLVLTGGMDFTVAAAGTLTVTDAYTAELVPYVDDNSAPAPGKAHVRFIHLVPDAPLPVNVGVTGVITPLFTGVTYKDATPYAPVDVGTYGLEAYLMGGPPGPIATVEDVVFLDGSIYNGFAVGLAADLPTLDVVITPRHRLMYLPIVTNMP